MDLGFKLKLENPKKNVGIFSKLFFGWVIPLIKKGVNEGLELENLSKVLNKDKSRNLADKLEEHWENEVRKSREKNSKPSLLKALFKQFYSEFLLFGFVWFYTNVIIICLRPIILAELIKLFNDKDVNKNYLMYVYSVALILTSFLSTMSIHHMYFAMQSIGMRVRVATSSLVYRKITRLNHKSLGETPAGKVVNILSNDLSRFDLAIPVIHAIWVMPFQVVVIFLIIWQQVGVAAVSGIVTMVLLTVPVQGFLATYVGKLRTRVSKKTDIRVKLMSEIVSGIQVIKMYAWEKPFEKLVKYTRASEMKDISLASFVRGLYASTMVFSDKLSLFTTLITYVLLGNIISADRVFSMAQSFGILQMAMAVVYPLAVSIGAEALISIRRLEEFLHLEEKDDEDIIRGPRNTGVTISYVDASWTDMECTLEDINIRIRPGTLCAIVGPVGSGKSSLLQLLTGELPTLCGGIEIGGEISYSAQQPWLFQSTVRNNIIFGNHYDKNLYKRVVKVCALESDFEQFPHGDRTIVGEKGVSLSGGQRARINLARAVYRKADIYLLDDPLSAVDIHVGKHLFNECICEFLKGKTRILVTHQLQYLKKADLIIVLNDGIVEAQGTFEELSKCNLDFTKILVAADETEENINEDTDTDLANSDTEECRKFSITSSTKMSLMSLSSSDVSEKGGNQIIEEKSGDGPNSKPFKNYLASVRYNSLVVLVIFLLISSQALIVGIDQWLTLWTSQEQIRHSNGTIIIQIQPFNNTIGYNNGSLHPSNHVEYFNKLNDNTNSKFPNKYNEEVKKNYSDNTVNNRVLDFVKNHDEHTINGEYNFFDKNNNSINTNHSFYNKDDKRIKKRESPFVNRNYEFMNNLNDKSVDNTDRYNKPHNIKMEQEFFENKNNSNKNHGNIFNKSDSIEKEHGFFENNSNNDQNNANNFSNFSNRGDISKDQEFLENNNNSEKKHENIFNKPESIEKEHGVIENKNNGDVNNVRNFNKPKNIEKVHGFFENKNNSDENNVNNFNKPNNIDKEHGLFENENNSDKNHETNFNKPDSIEKEHGFFENKNNSDENNINNFNKPNNIEEEPGFFENKNNSDKNNVNNFNKPNNIEKDHGFFENKNNSDENNVNNFKKPKNIEKEQGFSENKNNSDKNNDNSFSKSNNIEKAHGFLENNNNSYENNNNNFNKPQNIERVHGFFDNKNNSDKNNVSNFNKPNSIEKDHGFFENKNNSDKNNVNNFKKPKNIEKEQGFSENKNNSDKNNDNSFSKSNNIEKAHGFLENNDNSYENNDNNFNKPQNIEKVHGFFDNKNNSDKNNVNNFNKPNNIEKDHGFFENKNNSDENNVNNFKKPKNIEKEQGFSENKNNSDKNNDNSFSKSNNIEKAHGFLENNNNSYENNDNNFNNPTNIEKEQGFSENKNNSDENNVNNFNKPNNIEKGHGLFENKNNSDKNHENIFNQPDSIEKEHGFFENKNNSDRNNYNNFNNPINIEKKHGFFENKNNSDENNANNFKKLDNTSKDQEFFENKNKSDKNHENITNMPDSIEKEHGFFENNNNSDKNNDNNFKKLDNINNDQEFFETKNNSDKNHDNIINRPDNIEKEHGFFRNKNYSYENNVNNFNKPKNIEKEQVFFENSNNSDKNNDNNFKKLENINNDQEFFETKNNSDKNHDNIINRPDNIKKEHGFFENKNNSDKNNYNNFIKLDNINREDELFKNKNNSDKNNDHDFYKPENINKEFFGSKNDKATTNSDLFNNANNITNNEHHFFDHHTENIHNITIDNITMNAWNRIIRKLHVHDILSYVTLNINNMFDYVIADGTLQRLYKTESAMYIYGTMIILVILLVLSRTFLFFTSSVMASENLHSMMFNKLLKAPMRFFDTNPSGRILNRFSKDVGCIDEILPRVLLDSVSIFLVMAGILVNIVIASPIMIIALIILGALYLKFRSWYMVTAKTLKHLEGITKSPVFSHVSSTLCGIVTIRASHSEDILIDEFDRHQDVHTSAWYLTLACMNAFGIWLDLIVLVFLAIVTFSFVILTSVTNVNGSSVGLAVSQCMVLTGMLQYGMKQLAEVINNLTSVERILQYTTIENEGPFETPKEKRPKGTWPTRGNVEFKKLYLKYVQNDPPVLKNLNVVFKSGEKIGIVGRTGAGKSSLISALFRLAPLEGSVLIDRVDINNLGLTDLRNKISIIPQEPVLFSESLRYNLDPFNEFDDDKIWDTLELVEMKDSVDSLDFLVAEGGANFSLGQRQLICLARAILKENKILVLDEATANVDHKTDSLIQGTIRKVFKDCTVLTIAHRLNTIMDSDKVLVMSFGNAVEYDHPHNLLQIEDGYFHKMVLETSPNMAQELKNIARNAYLKQMEEKDD